MKPTVGKVVNEVLQKSGKGVDIATRMSAHGRLAIPSVLVCRISSTPGIAALARLGFHIGFDLSTGDPCATILSSPAKRDSGGKIKFVLPADICAEIVQYLYLYDPIDILNFGSISPPCQDAAMRILSYPRVANHRLLSRIRVPVASSEELPYPQLYSAYFEVVAESGKVNIQIGATLDWKSQKITNGSVAFIELSMKVCLPSRKNGNRVCQALT